MRWKSFAAGLESVSRTTEEDHQKPPAAQTGSASAQVMITSLLVLINQPVKRTQPEMTNKASCLW